MKRTIMLFALVLSVVGSCFGQEDRVIDLGNGVTIKMIYVEGGTFMMGNENEDDEDDDALPLHEVTLSDYYISETEVTVNQWFVVMGGLPDRYGTATLTTDDGDVYMSDYYFENWTECCENPIFYVTQDDAFEYVDYLNVAAADALATGESFALPTEAQWEYAARGGQYSKGYVFAGSDDHLEVAWSQMRDADEVKVHHVGQLMANELGLYDMSGNVSEWCSDVYAPYTDEAQTDPTGGASDYAHPVSGIQYKVVRGGNFTSRTEALLALACRGYAYYTNRFNYLGMRLVMSVGETSGETGVGNIVGSGDVVEREFYDLLGRRVTGDGCGGIVVVREVLADGGVRSRVVLGR